MLHGIFMRTCLALGLALALASGSLHAQGVLEVTHTPGTGQYATIAAAIDSGLLQDGSVIEIIDNSAPFTERVTGFSANNLTIRGKASLNPRPTVVGTFDGSSFNENFRLENLILDVPQTELAAVVLTCKSATITNCKFIGNSRGLLTDTSDLTKTYTYVNCEFAMENSGLSAFDIRGGHVIVRNCEVRGPSDLGHTYQGAVGMSKGIFEATDSFIQGGTEVGILLGAGTNDTTVSLTRCVLTVNTPSTGNSGTLIMVKGDGSANQTLLIDQSDLIGSRNLQGDGSPTTHVGILIDGSLPKSRVSVRKTVLSLTRGDMIRNNSGADGNSVIEDYNAFQSTIYVPAGQGFPGGAHSVSMSLTDALYVNVAGGDFRVHSASAAAWVDPAGAPAWAGSTGLVQDPAIEVSHTPTVGQFSSVVAAFNSGLVHNGSVIEIVDNSAPFEENFTGWRMDNLTLRGKAGLNPKPTFKGVIDGSSDNINFRAENLILDVPSSGLASVVFTGKSATVTNCIFTGASRSVLTAGADTSRVYTFNNCEFLMETSGLATFDLRGGRIIANGCNVRGPIDLGHTYQAAVNLSKGTFEATDSRIQGGTEAAFNINGGDDTTVSLTRSIVTVKRPNDSHSGQLMIIGSAATAHPFIKLNQCDLIGCIEQLTDGTPSTDVGIKLNGDQPNSVLQVRKTIFSLLRSAPILNESWPVSNSVSEDYNVYQNVDYVPVGQGYAGGAHSVSLNLTEPLYFRLAFEDLRLMPESLAATIESSGNPTWAGSKGVVVLSAARHWDLY